MNLKFSFIVPAYKCANTLDKCLKSIPSGNEIIVVGRNNADDIRPILDKYPGILFIETEIPGAAHARNLGAQAAKAEFLAFLDADTYLPDDFQEPINLSDYDIFAYTIEYSFLYGGSLHHYLQKRKALTNQFNFATALRGYFLYLDTAFVIVKKKAFFKNGGFNPQLLRFEDRDFGYRAQLSGARIHLQKSPCPVKILDESGKELFLKKIKDVYWQSKTIFTAYAPFLKHIQEANPINVFKDEVRLIFYLRLHRKSVQFLYVLTELTCAVFFQLIFKIKSLMCQQYRPCASEQSCLITCGSRHIFKSY